MDDDFNSYDFDKILAKIQEESLRHYNEVELPRAAALKEQEQNKRLDVSEGDLFKSKVTSKDGNQSFADCSESLFHHGEDAEGFHYAAGKTYIYPSNYPVRKYQADIVPTALFHNTLVSLPTGLGKTFIAAVVMYNFYRWYPMGKVIFMAPTKPLVTQQLSACRDIMGIPIEDTVELTGSTSADGRKLLWNTKRVFYLTPQVLMNDLRSNLLQASTIKCLVIDEAHRATKGYAYCQVVKILFEENVKFRLLALSATPGTDASAVKDVIQNLRIEKLEVRSEDSEDVVEYSHTKSVIPIIVDLPAFLRDIWNQYMEVYENYVRKIRELKVLNQNIATMSKFQMLTAFRKFTSRPPSTLPENVLQSINGDFTSCITLAHGRELLQTYGLRTFHSYFTDAENSNDKAASITRLSHDISFRQLLGSIEKIIFKEDNGDSRQYNWSHPKMEHLVSVVSEHFESKAQAGENTKAIIFCQYRLVVTEVFDIMKKFVPHAKPVMFVGQSSKEKGQGLPQKKQIEVMKMFRSGEYNVMIATSVAEEGLDIGDVDLIVSMETHRSPIKLVQRFGRTGRKRSGRCVVLLTNGAEVKKFEEVMSTQKNYSSIISAPSVRVCLEQCSPRMVPQNCNPKLQLLHIKVPKSDKRKQCDIRNVFGKFDTSRKYAAPAAPSVPTSAFLTDDELAEVRDELGSYFPNFNRLPESCELWPRQKGPRLEIDEFASDKFSGFSDWLDWSKDLQQTHVVGHSRDTKLLVELLQKASEISERTDEPVHNLVPSPPTSLWSTVGANQNQKKKNEGGRKMKTNGKNQPKSKHGMDIRDCLAKVPPKAGFISQDSTMDDVFLAPHRKHANNKNLQNISAIQEADDVIVIDDDLDRMLGDILCGFPNILGKTSYCSLSRNKDIRSVVMKCVNLPVKCELRFEILPDICELLEGITIDDVKNLELSELPCLKSTSSLNKRADFGSSQKDSSVVSEDYHRRTPSYEVVDFESGKKESSVDVEYEDSCMSTESFIVGIDDLIKPSNVCTGQKDVNSPLKDFIHLDSQSAKKESSVDVEDEDSCMSTESFIVGIDDLIKSFNVSVQKDVNSPLKDFTNLDSQKHKLGCNGFEEKDLSPILSQRPQNTLKGKPMGNFSNLNMRKDDKQVVGCKVENDISPILSQRPQKTMKGLNGKCLNSFSNTNPRKYEGLECSSLEEKGLSPILSQRPQKILKGSIEKCKRKLEVDIVDKQPKCSKNVDKSSENYFEDNQEFDTAFLDEFADDMLADLSPILSCKSQKFKKPENRCRSKEIEQELSPILSQAGGKKCLSKFGEAVMERSRIPNVTSSTPKCVKKDLFQNRLQNSSKFNLPSVQEINAPGNSDLDEKMLKEVEENKENDEDEEEVWGIDQILESSKCGEDKSSTIIDPTPTHSPKQLSYYTKGNSLYSVTQLVEKAVKLEKEGIKQNGINIVEEKLKSDNKVDEFILNSSDDDLFDCADSKIDLNFEVENLEECVKHEKQVGVSVNKCNQSVIEISDGSKSVSSKNDSVNLLKDKSEEVMNDDDDYFEITGLDELMQNCFDNKSGNLEKSKSPAIDSKLSTIAHPKASELKMETGIMDSEEDELIENCLDDNFIDNLEKSKLPVIDSKPSVSVGQFKPSNSCKSEHESLTGKSKSENDISTSKKVSDLPNKPEKCTTQFKSDYLSNEELEELLKSGVFSDSPIITPNSKLETSEIKSVDVTENNTNDTEIIDNSNELHLESPLLLSYGNRSDKAGRSLCNKSTKDDCPKNSKFSFLSKSKSKGGLKFGKENQSKLSLTSKSEQKESFGTSSLGLKGSSKEVTKRTDNQLNQSKPSLASKSKQKESFSTGSLGLKGSSKEVTKRTDNQLNQSKPSLTSKSKQKESFSTSSLGVKGSNKEVTETADKSDGSFSWGSSVKGAGPENINIKHKKSDESFSWGSPSLKGTIQDNISTKHKKSDESFSWGSPSLKGTNRDHISTKHKKSDESFSWGSPSLKGTNRDHISTKHKKSDESFSRGSPSLKGTNRDHISTKHKKSDENFCLEDAHASRRDVETNHKKSAESFSWETRDVRGCRQDAFEKESNDLKAQNEPSTSAQNNESVIHIDDDSIASAISNCKLWRPKIILSGSSTDIEEASFPSIHTSVQRENRQIRTIAKPSFDSRKSTSFKGPSKSSDSDDSSEIFITSINKKSDRSHDDSGAVPLKHVGSKNKKSKKKKQNEFIESEADVSGDETSSGKETSGLDSLDESFVDDKTNADNTMMVAHYLQTVKNPKNIAGGYRIPEMSDSVMARDVYSQYVPLEHETYVNDSFCVNESGSDESEMSELEIAEKLLAKRKKSRKHKKTKRKRQQSTSESGSSQESRKREEINQNKKKKKRRIVILDDSD